MAFNIMDLQTFGIGLVVVGIVLGLGGEILGDLREDQCTNWTGTSCGANAVLSAEFNITSGGSDGLLEMGDRLDTVGLIAVVGVILGIIMVYLGRRTAG